MNIDEFLSLRGTDLSTVLASVKVKVDISGNDVLLAVGSLVEGLGTSKSDLDLLWITTRGERSLPFHDHVTWVVGRCLIDLRVLRLVEFEKLLNRFSAWSQLPWNVTHAEKFNIDDRTLLHRLLHGRILQKDRRGRLLARIPSRKDVSRLKLHVARQASRTVQVDMVGNRESGDYTSLVFASQELLGHSIDALVAGYQLTNPLQKWRSRMLDALPSDWERSLRIRPSGLPAKQKIWRLHRAPQQPSSKLARLHAFRITTFTRAVFMWSELQLVKGAGEKPERINWPEIKYKRPDSPLPYIDLDVDFFLSDGRVSIARLNEFDKMVEMSAREFSLVLLFDGTSTPREAQRVVYGSSSDKEGARVMRRLISQIELANLCVSMKSK